MYYDDEFAYLDENVIYFDNLIEKIKNADLEIVWSGDAFTFMTESLIKDVDYLKIQNDNLLSYNKALKLMEEYAKLDEKINQLYSLLPSGDDEESQIARSLILTEIAQLETQKAKLKVSILNLLSTIIDGSDVEDTSLSASDIVTSDNGWDGNKLTAQKGFIVNGPSGYETWCPYSVNEIVKNMSEKYHHTNVVDSIREDGVRVLSGVTPDGVVYKELVIVAADVYHPFANSGGTFQRGEFVETSLGTGIVVDYCGEAVRKRKNDPNDVHFDIYAAWYEEPWCSEIYGKK